MSHPIASMVDSYLEGHTSKEDAASQIVSFIHGDITAAGVDKRKVEKFTELMDSVQPQTTPLCVTVSILRCTALLAC
jgi:hypothetical protein